MANLTLKGVPEELLERLRRRARANRRSLNGEIIACLERAVGVAPADPEAILGAARDLRRLTEGWPLDDEELARVRREGRA